MDDLLLAKEHFRAARWAEAEAAARRVLSRDPNHVDAMNVVANCAAQTGRPDDAIPLLKRVVELKPHYGRAHNNLAFLLLQRGRADEALPHARRACELAPEFPTAHFVLAKVLDALEDGPAALRSMQRVVELDPNHAEAHMAIGELLETGPRRFDLAEASYREAFRADPARARALMAIANTQGHLVRIDDAVQTLRHAVALAPDDPGIHSHLLFMMEYQPDVTVSELESEQRRFSDRFAAASAHDVAPFDNDRSEDRPLRIAYSAPYFHEHSVSFFFEPIVAHHDRKNFRVTLYSDDVASDAVTERFRSTADEWCDSHLMDHDALARRIREDRIDVLVELTQHTLPNRMLAWARKPAPVVVSYLAYPAPTGLRTIDHWLSDPFLGSNCPGPARVALLPETYFCYRDPDVAPDVRVEPPCARNGFVQFVSHHSLFKLNERCVDVWARVLRAIPGSRLLMRAMGCAADTSRERLVRMFAQHGIDADRLSFRAFGSLRDVMTELNDECDVALDAIPFSGATTACHTLWMGVPMVTLAGERPVHRMGFSVLSQVGLNDLAASDEDGFVRVAVDLAGDPARLAELRRTMRDRLRASPLMNAARLTANLEGVYRQLWRNWCRSPG